MTIRSPRLIGAVFGGGRHVVRIGGVDARRDDAAASLARPRIVMPRSEALLHVVLGDRLPARARALRDERERVLAQLDEVMHRDVVRACGRRRPRSPW